jgi:hypothetical protein
MNKRLVVENDRRAAWLEAFAERHQRIGPKMLLEEARNPSCPFHSDFEWDDDKAGELYRLSQAAGILRRWKGILVRQNSETKSIEVSVERRVESPKKERGRGKPSYIPVEDILGDKDLREEMLRTVLNELKAYRRRYAKLHELAAVWYELDMLFTEWLPLSDSPEDRTQPPL